MKFKSLAVLHLALSRVVWFKGFGRRFRVRLAWLFVAFHSLSHHPMLPRSITPVPGAISFTARGLKPLMQGFLLIWSMLLVPTGQAQGVPQEFDNSFSFGGKTVAVHFRLSSLRSPNFKVLVQDDRGEFTPHKPDVVRTYLGTVVGHPGAIASGLRRADGRTFAHISFEDGTEWMERGKGVELRTELGWEAVWPDFISEPGGAGSRVYAAEVGVDATEDYVRTCGGTVGATLEMIEFSIGAANLVHIRDAGVMHRLGRVVIRASASKDPYAGMDTTEKLLAEVSNQWKKVLPQDSYDLALVARTSVNGGLAPLSTAGTPDAVSSNLSDEGGDFSIVWRHEAAHNWSVRHYEGGVLEVGPAPEGKTINSGNSLSRMSGAEEQREVAYRNAHLSALDDLGAFGLPIPPRASLDRAEFEPGASQVVIDVLANDHDANGEAIKLVGLQEVSDAGGTVKISSGTGPGGRDQVLYLPAATGRPRGFDHFTYRIQDASGQEGLGNVMVRNYPIGDDLAGYWAFNESTGKSAKDSSSYGVSAAFQSEPLWGDGVNGGAVSLSGGNYALAGSFGPTTDRITLCAWVRRSGNQPDFTGIIACRDGQTGVGLTFGTQNELRYFWGSGTQWGWDSGLIVPEGVWTFVALVVEPDLATLYMHDGTELKSASNQAIHLTQAPNTSFALGADASYGSARAFTGWLDEARFYRRVLSADEINTLAGGLGIPSSPRPGMYEIANEEVPADAGIALSWTASSAATAHRVFFSRDYTAVRDAAEGGPADLGLAQGNTINTPRLAAGTYFWRVDASNGDQTFRGQVWSFSVKDVFITPPLARWKMDETSGSLLSDSEGKLGATSRGVVLGRPGATANTGTAVGLSGAGSSISVPPLNLTTNRVTFTAWIRRNGPQPAFAGLVFSRSSGTTAGLHFGPDNSLRYTWNDAPATWGFDSKLVVPDRQWTFVALIVEPSRAVLHMIQNGVASSVTNLTEHPLQPFETDFYFGRDPGHSTRVFTGDVDEVAIYPGQSLSKGQLLRLANPGQPPVAKTLPRSRDAGSPLLVSWSELSAQWSDADGDELRLASISPLTDRGATVSTNSAGISYPASGPTASDRITYTLSDSRGMTAQGAIDISVNAAAPVISVEPADVTLTEGDTLTLSVKATGTEPLAYQWYFKGSSDAAEQRLPGATQPTLTLSGVNAAKNAGSYLVRINESVSSRVAIVTVRPKSAEVSIIQQSSATTVVEGETLNLTVEVSGPEPLAYQWFFSATANSEPQKLPGATQATLSIPGVKLANQGFYFVSINGQITSTLIAVTVRSGTQEPVAIVRQPFGKSVSEGDSLTLNVVASGGNVTYQWVYTTDTSKPVTYLDGQTNAILTVPAVQKSNEGFYAVFVNDIGSRFARVTVTAKPVARVADTGFLPDRDGFSFPNYGGPDGDWKPVNLTAFEIQRLFGDRVIASRNGDQIVLTPPGQKWLQQQSDGMNGGHCEGMAVLSTLLYDKKVDLRKFGVQNTFDLNLRTNILLQREIGFWFVTQATFPSRNGTIKGTPVEILDRLIDSLKPNATETYTVGVYAQPPLKGGHAVTPYAVEDMGGGIFHVLVYDNNHVGTARRLIVDRNKNTWELSLSTNPSEAEAPWRGDADSRTFEICASAPRLTQQDCPFCDEPAIATASLGATPRFSELYVDGDGVLILLTDAKGRRFGYVNGRLVEEIPGVSLRRSKSDDSLFQDDPAPVISIPVGLQFTLTLDGTALTKPTASDVVFIGPGYDVAVEGVMLNPGQKDSVAFTADGTGVSYTSSNSESPDISIGFEAKGADYSFTVKGVEADPGATITMKVDKAKQTLNLSSSGNKQTASYELIVGRYSDTKSEEFSHDNVELGPKDSAIVEYGKWGGDHTSVPLLIDHDSNGTIDETLLLTDEDAPPSTGLPRVLAALGADGRITVSWASVDPSIVLESTPVLGGSWTRIPSAQIVTGGGSSHYTIASTGSSLFYRLRRN